MWVNFFAIALVAGWSLIVLAAFCPVAARRLRGEADNEENIDL